MHNGEKMGIEKLKGSLLSEANSEADKIIKESEGKCEKLLEEERNKFGEMKKFAEEEVGKKLSEEKRERIAWARLESKRILAEAREDAIKGVIENMFEHLASVRKTPGYKKYIEKAVSAGLSDIGDDSTIHVVKGDKALIKNGNVIEDLEGLGGVLIESKNGKMLFNMTLETRFDSLRDQIRKRISDEIFGGS